MLHLDFEFRLDDTHLAIVGWCSAALLDRLYIQDNDRILFPIMVSDHARRDLRTDELRGFIALFETPEDTDLTRCSFMAEGEGSLFPLDDDAKQFGLFVHKAVDETFWDFCARIGTGEVQLRGAELVSTIRARIQNATGNFGETPRMAAGLDQAIATQARGVALLTGWIASDRAQSQTQMMQRAAFAVCENALLPVKMYWDCHLRPDLSAFGDRFSLTGSEGFAGVLQTSTDDGPIETLVVCAQYRRGQVVLVRSVDDTTAAAALDAVQTIDGQLNAPDLIADIRLALRPRVRDLQLQNVGTFPGTKTGVTLILEHDAADHDIRDVLRLARAHLGPKLNLLVIRNTMSRGLKDAIQAECNEAGDLEMQFDICAPDTALNAWPLTAPVMVFASSSALIQLEPWAVLAALDGIKKDGTVIVYDPILALSGAPKPAMLAAGLARGRLPFVAMLNTGVLPQESGQFDGFATAEAQMRLLILSLFKAGRIDIALADTTAFFDGSARRAGSQKTTAHSAQLLASLDSESIAQAFVEQGA